MIVTVLTECIWYGA